MKGVIILACVALLACAAPPRPVLYPPVSYIPEMAKGSAR